MGDSRSNIGPLPIYIIARFGLVSGKSGFASDMLHFWCSRCAPLEHTKKPVSHIKQISRSSSIRKGSFNLERLTPLHFMMVRQSNSTVEFLLARIPNLGSPFVADLNAKYPNGQTVLHILVNGYWRWITTAEGSELVTELIKLGAEPNAIDEDGFTPLHNLIQRVNETDAECVLQMICKLVEHGANLNARNKYRQTILHQLLLKPHRNDIAISHLVTEILRLGADPNLRDKYRRSAAWLSMPGLSEGNVVARLSIINELAQHGADLNLKDRRGRTPLSVLMSKLRSDNVDATVKMVAKLVELGVDPNVKDEKGRTVLHFLMEHGPLDHGDATLAMITKLVELGFADMNARDNNGRTAMHFLILNLYAGVADDTAEAMTRKLVDLGVNLNLQDKDGQTVLHFLAKKSGFRMRQKGRLFAILDQNGVDLATIEDNKGNTPLTYLGNPYAFDATTGFLWLRSMVSSGYLQAD